MTTVPHLFKGRLADKQIHRDHFEVRYACACGTELTFYQETKLLCLGCGTEYQCRVMVGRPKAKQ